LWIHRAASRAAPAPAGANLARPRQATIIAEVQMDSRKDATVACPILGMAHVTIKAADLPATIAFYAKVLGLRQVPRPPFSFPGAWLGTVDGDALIHLLGGERARGVGGTIEIGSAAIDHVSLWARGLEAQRARFEAFGLPYRSQPVPASDLVQLFVFDPNGVLIELTYRRTDEPGAAVGERGGTLHFEPARYAQFGA
jgi:catechol 2,3-dioxygenase-like lactoylglutathione lyase family enzyme